MKINVNKKEKLEAAIDAVEERARERLLSINKIYASIDKIEERLSELLLKRQWSGLEFTICEEFSAPSSYFGIPESTYVTVFRGGDSWFVTDIKRAPSRANTIRMSTKLKVMMGKINESLSTKVQGASYWNK